MPGRHEPLVPFRIREKQFAAELDTGSVQSVITPETATLIEIDRYPKRFIYDQQNNNFTELHLIPIQIVGLSRVFKIKMEFIVWPVETNIVSAEEFLRRNLAITFTSEGIRIGN